MNYAKNILKIYKNKKGTKNKCTDVIGIQISVTDFNIKWLSVIEIEELLVQNVLFRKRRCG